jgi:M3 family oligoendopeptidase
MAEIGERLRSHLNDFRNASTFEEQDAVLNRINDMRNDYYSMSVMAFINYSIDTNNKAYQDEQDFFDNNNPIFSGYVTDFYRELVKARFRSDIEKKYGKHLFDMAEVTLKTFSPEIVEDLQKENQLGSKYMKLKASAKIMFEGEEKNLQELEPYMQSPDREIRKKANKAYWDFFASKESETDEIYDSLVKLRDKIAKKLGFENFTGLGYARMRRTDYNAQMVAKFRKQIVDHVVPLSVKLRERQMNRLGVDKLTYYDASVQFKSGNATPKGSPEWIVENGKKMYEELSPETEEFFNFMIENDLMDLYSRKGKADMGYCDYIPKYKAPFIFANFNGTDGDITVLTHEAGHAFQAYASRNLNIKEYMDPTSETAEIHSMSMEFFTWPWMDLFFKEDTDKFKFSHLSSALLFLPYGSLVDHYQHVVYENAQMTPAERKAEWRKLEKIYMPWLDMDGNDFLERGGKWHRQGHIFESPFYYIDYVLAQICAFQFWQRAVFSKNGEKEKAFKDYLYLCHAGGSKPFLELAGNANLKSPFDEGTIAPVAEDIAGFLDKIDDSKFE